jgi:hypothetical protein
VGERSAGIDETAYGVLLSMDFAVP